MEDRWREDGRLRSLTVYGPRELARKVECKRLSTRDENRHLDVRKEVRFRMIALIDRYEQQYAKKKRSYGRERAILGGLRLAFRRSFAHEIDGSSVERWYHDLTAVKGLSPGTALRHFNVLHHMMGRAATVWSKETGVARNPADDVEVIQPDDQRERFLSQDELIVFKRELDQAAFRGAGSPDSVFRRQQRRMRLVSLTA